ncbi:hypothetical protein Q8F55_001036 [Vanrija albida]|uniref:Zn(2)-C6 fungal-type domain-containing protein n=1 Tax=Vanrija albida TaxID=181172 RepID=A0ABR3QG08_9TREE
MSSHSAHGPSPTAAGAASTASSSASNLAAAGASGSGARRVKGKRTRTGCLTCRARKVKCDETPGTCANCERVLLACRWPAVRDVFDERGAAVSVKQEADEYRTSSTGPVRRNRNAACVACRTSRSVCSQDRPSCTRCTESGTVCKYPPERGTSMNSIHSGATPSSTDESPHDDPGLSRSNSIPSLHGIPRPVLDRHLEAFFTHVYPIQANAIVHRGTLLRDVADGRVARKVILAICAVAARFVSLPTSTPPGAPPPPLAGSVAAQAWGVESKAALMEDDMSLDNVTTALILAKHEINSGRFGRGFVLAAVATRTALALGLHRELPADDPATVTERETRRRLMWGCYSLDRMMSTGVPEFLSVPAALMSIRLPCDDQQYQFATPTDAPVPAIETEGEGEAIRERYSDVGIMGHHVRLQGIRVIVLRSSRGRDAVNDLPPWEPGSAFAVAERRLNAWRASLPPQFELERETIYARHCQNQLTPLIMLHIWYESNHSELYRLAMPGFPESLEAGIAAAAPPGWIERTRDACSAHASMIARTIRHMCSIVDPDTMIFADNGLPICILESVRIRLQHAFILPPAPQAAELAELSADVEIMDAFLQRMTTHLRQAKWLLKEMRRMLRRHGMDPVNGMSSADTSGAASPGGADPWSKRVRLIRNNPPHRPAPVQQQAFLAPPNQPMGPPQSTGRGFQQQPTDGFGFTETTYNMAEWNPAPLDVNHEDVNAILGQLEQTQTGVGGMGSFLANFADWVATGYDPTINMGSDQNHFGASGM